MKDKFYAVNNSVMVKYCVELQLCTLFRALWPIPESFGNFIGDFFGE